MAFRLPKATHDVPRHPLLWPPEKARMPGSKRQAKRWSTSMGTAIEDLRAECQASRIADWAISTGVAPGTRTFVDPGAAMWFMQRVGTGWAMSCYASDTFRQPAENVKAIAMTINRLRLVADYGVYSMEQAMRGAAYEALPSPEPPPRPWWEVMGLAQEVDRAVVDAVYRALAKKRHPDAGGSQAEMQELLRAYDEAKRQTGS